MQAHKFILHSSFLLMTLSNGQSIKHLSHLGPNWSLSSLMNSDLVALMASCFELVGPAQLLHLSASLPCLQMCAVDHLSGHL